jgi:hypothetical protein
MTREEMETQIRGEFREAYPSARYLDGPEYVEWVELKLLEFGAFSMNHKPAKPFNVDECLAAFLSSRKQTDKEKG